MQSIYDNFTAWFFDRTDSRVFVLAKVPPTLALQSKFVSGLMASREGVQFWDENGDECKLSFDLSRQLCWDTLESYLRANNIQVQL